MQKHYESHMDPIPEFYLAVLLLFNRNIAIDKVLTKMQKIGIERLDVISSKHKPYAEMTCINIAIMKNERFWELDDALTEMFARIDHCLPQLKELVEQYQGKVCIDIAFYQYGTYPALYFKSENIRKISLLNADVGIDPC